MSKRVSGSTVLAIGGTLSAIVGSIAVDFAPWSARIMLVANLVTIALALIERRC